ncbi:MAG: hypothetical protein JXR85_01535 [Deltaproteobacteria bacterium]|nr:hypothetical protein [Deltaproteobacteria bacterium]
MDERDFEARINAAEAIRFLGNDNPVVDRFWEGFARGVRRLYHDMQSGTEEGHDIPLTEVENDDPAARAHGYGYQAGLNGHDIEAARKLLESIID